MLGALLEVELLKKCTSLWRQNVQNTPRSEHFWQLRWLKSACRRREKRKMLQKKRRVLDHFWPLRCWKSARHWPAAIFEVTMILKKHHMFRLLLEVEMSIKCTLLWREAHFEVKRVKTWRSRTTFGRWGISSTLHYTDYIALQLHLQPTTTTPHNTRRQLRYTTIRYTTLH